MMLAVSSALLACQTPRTANKLRIASAPAPLLAPQDAALAPIAATAVALQNLVGQANFGSTPMSDAVVSVKDPFTGKVLGGGNTDNKGQFSVPISVQPTNGLFQVVVSNSAGTVQAIEGVERPASSAYQLADVEPANGITVDWGSTVVAQTLGPKLVELSLADSGNTRHLGLLARIRSLAAGLKGKGDAASISGFRTQALATPAFRDALSSIVSEINSEIVSIFRSGQGAVFQIQPFSLPEAELSISAPSIMIDQAAGALIIVLNGKTEVIQRAVSSLIAPPLDALTNSTSLLNNPTTALVPPSIGAIGLSAPASTGEGRIGPLGAGAPATGSERSSGRSSRRSSGHSNVPDAPSADSEGEIPPQTTDPGPNKHDIWIDDIVDAETSRSILAGSEEESISALQRGKTFTLKISGKLNAEHPPKLNDDDYRLGGFPFEGLVQQTFVANKPLRKVLLDDSIFIPIQESSTVTDSQLTVSLNTSSLIDLDIPGRHWITVIDRESEASVDIRCQPLEERPSITLTQVSVATGVKFKPNGHHSPNGADNGEHGNGRGKGKDKYSILDIDDGIAGEDEDENNRYLLIEGDGFPVSFYQHWISVNGTRIFAHATWVNGADGKSKLYAHLPESLVLKGPGSNALLYANPFGFKMVSF